MIKKIAKWSLFFLSLLVTHSLWALTYEDDFTINELVYKFNITGNLEIEARHKQILQTFLKDSKI